MRALSTKLKLSAAGLLVAVGSFFAINAVLSDADATTARDCSSNAVITCGVMSVSEMRTKYNNDSPRGTKNIFAGMGITSEIVNKYKVQEGTVYGNGNVVVGGKTVATDARSAGREKMVGGTERTYNGTRFYDRPVGLWNLPSWPSYIFTDSNGKFVGAVMKNCGNPVKAKPVEPPKPKPAYSCASLSRIKQDSPTKYVFRGKAAATNGAKATGFTFDFGDGKSRHVSVERTEGKYAYADAAYTYTRSGTYNVKVTAHFTVNGKTQKATSEDCQKPVTINVPAPKKPGVTIDKQVSTDGAKEDGMTREEALEEARKWRPEGHCTTVMTPAVHVETGARYTFNSGCLPPGWVREDRQTPGQPTATTTSATTTTTSDRNGATNWRDHATVELNKEFRYLLVVKNTGEVALKDVNVTDPAPAGVTFLSADRGTISNNTWSYTIPSLAVNESVTVVITAKVTKQFDGRLINTACVDAPAVPGDKDDCDDATIDVKKPEPKPEPTKYIEVCRLSDKQYPVTIREEDFDKTLHSKDADDCEEEEVTKPVVKETVTELPQTGIAEAISGIVGLGALTTASYYYLASRRS